MPSSTPSRPEVPGLEPGGVIRAARSAADSDPSPAVAPNGAKAPPIPGEPSLLGIEGVPCLEGGFVGVLGGVPVGGSGTLAEGR